MDDCASVTCHDKKIEVKNAQKLEIIGMRSAVA